MKQTIITVTLNPALDKTINLDSLNVGGLNRVTGIRVDPGGKGINVAKVLNHFGEQTIAVGFAGGHTGNQLLRYLDDISIKQRFIDTVGETRTNIKIVDIASKITTEINERGADISEEEQSQFMELMDSLLNTASVLVLGGSISPGVSPDIYRTLSEMAELKGVRTILDADGDALVHGLKARPYAIKPNIHELEEMTNKRLSSDDEIVQACREIINQGIKLVVVSMGGEGSIFITSDEVIRARPFPIVPQSTVGAGDSMVAAITSSLIHGRSLEDTARWATASGSITASLSGTEVCSKDEVEQHLNLVHIEKW
jgi:1-phosphofructokinase